MKNRLYIFTIIFITISSFCFSGDIKKVIVTSSLANIRATPGLEGEILRTALKGDVFEVLATEESWYKIVLAIDKSGDSEFGYIHSTIVKIVTPEVTIVSSPVTEPEIEKTGIEVKPSENREIIEKNGVKVNQKKLFSGFYLKAGLMTSPEVDSFGDKWIISLGFDKAIGSYMTWGLEFQPYYRNFGFTGIDLMFHSLTSNAFLNIKGGLNLGKLIKPLRFLTLYGGFGAGANLSFSYIDFEGKSSTGFRSLLSWHYMFGGEISLGKMNLILEIQGVKVIDPDIDPSTMSLKYFMVGIRF